MSRENRELAHRGKIENGDEVGDYEFFSSVKELSDNIDPELIKNNLSSSRQLNAYEDKLETLIPRITIECLRGAHFNNKEEVNYLRGILENLKLKLDKILDNFREDTNLGLIWILPVSRLTESTIRQIKQSLEYLSGLTEKDFGKRLKKSDIFYAT